jgi:Bacterial Ig-like domain (group 2)
MSFSPGHRSLSLNCQTTMSTRQFLHAAKWRAVFLLCIFCLLVSCDGTNRQSPPAMPARAKLQAITISPSSAIIPLDDEDQFSAMGHYSDGSSKPLTTAKWTITDAPVMTVTSDGLVTASANSCVRQLRGFCFPGSSRRTQVPPIKQPLALEAEAFASGCPRKMGQKKETFSCPT